MSSPDTNMKELQITLDERTYERDTLYQQLAEAEAGSKVWEQSAMNISAQLTVTKELHAEAQAEIARLKEENEDLQTKCTEAFDDQVLNTVSRTQWEALTTALSALVEDWRCRNAPELFSAEELQVFDLCADAVAALLDSVKES